MEPIRATRRRIFRVIFVLFAGNASPSTQSAARIIPLGLLKQIEASFSLTAQLELWGRPAYLGPMTEPTTDYIRQVLFRGRELLRPLMPKRWRGLPLVPVVRLSGVIGFSTPRPRSPRRRRTARPPDRAVGMGDH